MKGGARNRKGLAVFAMAVLPHLALSACGEKPGSLMLAVSTNMKAPKDVSLVSVTVLSNNSVKYNYLGRVTPNGEVKLPATLAVAAAEDSNPSIRIRVIAFQERKPRVLRDVRTSIPKGGRQALLRLPLNFLDDGSATGELSAEQLGAVPRTTAPSGSVATGGSSTSGGSGTTGGSSASNGLPSSRLSELSSGGDPGAGFGTGELDPYSQFQSTCGPDDLLTSIDGECRDSFVDPETLPDYSEELVFGAGVEGSCFDVARCMSGAVPVTGSTSTGAADRAGEPAPVDAGAPGTKSLRPLAGGLDLETCSLARGTRDPATLNLALVTPDTGECVAPGTCFVPLDKGESGWRDEGSVLRLASGVCKRIREGRARLFEVSGVCVPKEESNPICATDGGSSSPPSAEDAGIRDAEPAPASFEIVSTEHYPTSVTVLPRKTSPTLLFVGASRLAALDLTTKALTEVRSFGPANNLPPPSPWHIETTSADSVVASSTNSSSFGVDQQGSVTREFDFSSTTSPPTGTALQSMAYFAVGSGIQYAPLFDTQPLAFLSDAPSSGLPVTSLLGIPSQSTIAVGFEDGKVGGCVVQTGTLPSCAFSSIGFVAQGRIDAMVMDPANSLRIFVLVANRGVFPATLDDTLSFSFKIEPSLDPSAGPDIAGVDTNAYYPRGLVAADRCVVYTGSSAIHYSAPGNPSGRILLPAGFVALGVAYANGQLYVANHADQSKGGGIYRVPLPSECRTTALPDGGVDAGDSGVDAGDAGVDAADAGDAGVDAADAGDAGVDAADAGDATNDAATADVQAD